MRYMFHIYSLSRSPGDPLREWREAALRTWLCPGCLTPREGVREVDVYLENEPDRAPLNFVAGTGVGYASASLLEALGVVTKNLLLGKVFDSGGRPHADFITFRGHGVLFIRGGEGSIHRVCEHCGRDLYHPIGPRYLVAGRLGEHMVYESQLHQLIVGPEELSAIEPMRSRKLGVERLPVRDEPRDGLSGLRL